MPDYLLDVTLWLYVAIAVVSAWGLFLFIWWWKNIGNASEIYIYFTILLASKAFYSGLGAVARYFHINDNDLSDFSDFTNSFVWTTRSAIHLFIITVIVIRMSMRMFATIKKANRFKLEEESEGSDVQGSNR
jgi:hypothetical protein